MRTGGFVLQKAVEQSRHHTLVVQQMPAPCVLRARQRVLTLFGTQRTVQQSFGVCAAFVFAAFTGYVQFVVQTVQQNCSATAQSVYMFDRERKKYRIRHLWCIELS
jgi:hypothetical protein